MTAGRFKAIAISAAVAAGVALVGLPILLHLIMKQEPKRLSFPAFRFLTQKLKTNQRKLRLRHFILLALLLDVVAAAMPFVEVPVHPAIPAALGALATG